MAHATKKVLVPPIGYKWDGEPIDITHIDALRSAAIGLFEECPPDLREKIMNQSANEIVAEFKKNGFEVVEVDK